jgi:type II secretion system protein H
MIRRFRTTRSAFWRRLRRARGFTLMELMTVIIIVGIMAVMAIPSMSAAAIDRHVYENAANIQDLIREARARAIGRGGSVLVSMSTNGQPGQYRSYEMRSDLTTADGGATQNLPITSCKGSNWTVPANLRQVGGADMDGSYETSNNIKSIIYGTNGAAVQTLYLCFTSFGRTFMNTTATFDADTAVMDGAIRVEVRHLNSGGDATVGIVRNVLIPPTGAARLVSGAP